MENVDQETAEVNVNSSPVPVRKTLFKPVYLAAFAVLIIALLVIGWIVFLPKPKAPQKTAVNAPQTVSAREAAAKVGYGILWQGDKNDNTGRSLIADDARDTSTTVIDSVALANPEQNPQNITLGLGVFKGWETIANSKDVYMVLENPLTKKTFKGRITFENSAANLVDSKNIQTLFLVEDMNYGPTTKTGFDASGYYFLVFETNTKEISQKAIKIGDVIGVRGLLENTAEQVVKKDSNGISVIQKVYLRRFGGITELRKELQ